MTKSIYHIATAVVACLLLAIAASAEAKGLKSKGTPSAKKLARADSKNQVTLEIAGPTDAQAVAAFEKALASNGLQAKIQEGKEGKKGSKPLKLKAAVDTTTDLGPWSKSVMTAMPTKPGQL